MAKTFDERVEEYMNNPFFQSTGGLSLKEAEELVKFDMEVEHSKMGELNAMQTQEQRDAIKSAMKDLPRVKKTPTKTDRKPRELKPDKVELLDAMIKATETITGEKTKEVNNDSDFTLVYNGVEYNVKLIKHSDKTSKYL